MRSCDHSSDMSDAELSPARISKLPYVALTVGYGFMLWVAWRQAASPLDGLVVGAVGLTLLVAARQMTAQEENVRLTTALVELATVGPGLNLRVTGSGISELGTRIIQDFYKISPDAKLGMITEGFKWHP